MNTARHPTAREVTAWIAALEPESYCPALHRGLRLVDELRAPYASRSRRAHAKATCRAALMEEVREDERVASGDDSQVRSAARSARDQRVSCAVNSEVDTDGSFFEAFRACVREIRERNDAYRREVRATQLRMAGDLSHLPKFEQDYHREIRAMYRA